MGLEEVKQGLEEDLTKQKTVIISEASEEKEKIMQSAKEEVESYRQTAQKQTNDLLSMMERREVSSTNLGMKKELLNSKKEAIDTVFRKVVEKLNALPGNEKKKILNSLVKQAKNEIQVNRVYCSKQDMKLIAGFETKEAPIEGGVICESKDGKTRVDLTFETLLTDLREKNLREIASKLFE